MLVTRDFPENRFAFFVTRRGLVKRTDLSAFSNMRSAGIIALGIEDGDSLVAVKITDGCVRWIADEIAARDAALAAAREQ